MSDSSEYHKKWRDANPDKTRALYLRAEERREQRCAIDPEYKQRVEAGRRATYKKYAEANREKISTKNKHIYEQRKTLAAADPEFRQVERARKIRSCKKYRDGEKGLTAQKAWAARKTEQDPDYFSRIRANNKYKKEYGITLEQYEAMFVAQDGKCAICRQPQNHKRHKRLHIDHDHETGVVRGLLCYRCNIGVGYFRDGPNLLRAAAAYIEAHRGFLVPLSNS